MYNNIQFEVRTHKDCGLGLGAEDWKRIEYVGWGEIKGQNVFGKCFDGPQGMDIIDKTI